MKFVLLLGLTIHSVLVFCQNHKDTHSKMKVSDEEFLIINPPNCQLLYDSIFIDQTEITNLHWLEYLYSIDKDSSQTFYKSQIIDSTYHHLDSLNIDYSHYPGFRMYPVIGVSYEQAKEYCKWRSDVVNSYLKNDKEGYCAKQRKLLKKLGLEIYYEFRLPTIAEWEYAASGGLKFENFPHGIIDKFSKVKKTSFLPKGQKIDNVSACLESLKEDFKRGMEFFELQSNVKEGYWAKSTNDYISCYDSNEISTTEVYNFAPNNYKLYDMIGNVAEMVAEKGIAKGGSFRNSFDSFTIKTNFRYDKPRVWLGFRCICVVHFKKIAKSK